MGKRGRPPIGPLARTGAERTRDYRKRQRLLLNAGAGARYWAWASSRGETIAKLLAEEVLKRPHENASA
jgi:hypothetical protein